MILRNIKTRTKMMMVCIMITVMLVWICVIFTRNTVEMNRLSLAELETTLREEFDSDIREQVETAVSLLGAVHEAYEEGRYTLDEAKNMGVSLLRSLRYGEEGFFFADTYEGVNIVQPGSEMEGKNRYEEVDQEGKYYVKELISNGRKPDGGYTDYHFPRGGG